MTMPDRHEHDEAEAHNDAASPSVVPGNKNWKPVVDKVGDLPKIWSKEIEKNMRKVTYRYHPTIQQELNALSKESRSAFSNSLRSLSLHTEAGYTRLPDAPSAILRVTAENTFEELLDSLVMEDDLDLREYEDNVRFLWSMLYSGANAAFLRVTNQRGLLRPAPTIYWRVNRTIQQCSHRAQINLDRLFQELAGERRNQLFVELGQGGGRCMDDRREWIRDNRCTDIGLSDKIYYQIDELLDRVIDFDALKRDGADLGADARKFFCRYAYKVIVIRAGKTNEDDVAYDDDVFCGMIENPELFADILREKLPLLATTDMVPDDVGIPDPESGGRIVHRGRDHKPNDPAFIRACELLAAKPDDYVRCGPDKRSVYEFMNVNPCGAVAGSFSKITQLKDDQIDMALGIRSTQYLEGKAYVDFMMAMTTKLTDDGFYVDDNVRANYGLEYRLKELSQVQRETGCPVYIVHGTGPDGEKDVPVAVIVTRSKERLEKAAKHLYPDAKISPVDVLANDDVYCREILERSRQAPEQLAAAAKR